MPAIYAVPVFDIFFRRAAHDWLWWYGSVCLCVHCHLIAHARKLCAHRFTPSFSYVGQGIIMGPETVLSMNAVRGRRVSKLFAQLGLQMILVR